jgi:hypothetical protein
MVNTFSGLVIISLYYISVDLLYPTFFLLYDVLVLHTVISTQDPYRATALLIPQLDCYERQPCTFVLDILNLSKQLW